MNKICTSQEQSKKLVELGIDVNTADMWYEIIYRKIGREDDDFGESIEYIELSKYPDIKETAYTKKGIPAWSLTALLGLMPFHIIENNNRFGFYQIKGFNKQGETYRFGYKSNYDFFLFETSWFNNPLDAAFEMVVWLKGNGKL